MFDGNICSCGALVPDRHIAISMMGSSTLSMPIRCCPDCRRAFLPDTDELKPLPARSQKTGVYWNGKKLVDRNLVNGLPEFPVLRDHMPDVREAQVLEIPAPAASAVKEEITASPPLLVAAKAPVCEEQFERNNSEAPVLPMADPVGDALKSVAKLVAATTAFWMPWTAAFR